MVRTRIAPSPTGQDLHIGNLYTALLNWAFARKHNGQFIVRIEDTDQLRKVDGAEEKILASLSAYGLESDENIQKGGQYGPYRQSDRLYIYKQYAEQLVKTGHAYYSFCSKKQLETFRMQKVNLKQALRQKDIAEFNIEAAQKRISAGEDFTIRLNVPENHNVTFRDIIRGDITINTDQIDDQVLLKSDGFPTYHLAVVVDDHLMKISHIIRGEEWINSTPKHVLVYNALGFPLPEFAHTPILRNPDKSKLSKRKNPVWSEWFLEQGFLPEAILNYLSLMGWSHPQEEEIFSLDEFVRVFDLKDVAALGPAFDIQKMTWMNGIYIRNHSKDEFVDKVFTFFKGLYPREFILQVQPLVQERIKTLAEFKDYVDFFFEEPQSYEIDLTDSRNLLAKIASTLQEVEPWTADSIGHAMISLAQQEGIKNSKFFMVLRVAISGKKITPPLNESMELLGRKECIKRIQNI